MSSSRIGVRFRSTLIALALVSCCAAAATAATVQVVPADTSVTLGDTFTLRIVTDAFPDLKAYQLIHRYGATIQYLGALPGEVLTDGPDPYVISPIPDVSAPADTAWTDCAKLFSSTSGPGVLLYLKFKATATGNSLVTCLGASFRDSLNHETLPGCLNGIVRVSGPVAVRRSTWGRVKQTYR